MKMIALNRLTAILSLLCVTGTASAQDVIVKKDQSAVMSKVLEITSTEIKYKKWNNQDGPTYSIDRSEVVSINYENGEVETFSNLSNQPTTNQQPMQEFAGYMEYTSNRLKLNGKILSDTEVKKLVDDQSYQTYLKGKKYETISDICFVSDIVMAVGAGVCFAFGKKVPGILLCVVDAACWVGWWCIDGTECMKQVATEYNRRNGNNYSFNISPSLLKFETPQSPDIHSLGLTISMNF